MIEGRLVSATGQALEEQERVRLRALDGPGPELLDVTSPGGQVFSFSARQWIRADEEDGQLVFEFNEVPAGRFELSVVSGGLFLWDPPALVVEAPTEDAVFTRRDDLAQLGLLLRAVDAQSGDALGRFRVQLQTGSAWNPGTLEVSDPAQPLAVLTAGLSFRWSVYADGYRPMHGDERDLERSERGLEATIPLTRGFGARFVLRDLDTGFLHDDEPGLVSALLRPPVAGATILADGDAAATSDSLGLADVQLDKEPARIEIRAPGWRVLGSSQFQDGRILGQARDVLVWMIAE